MIRLRRVEVHDFKPIKDLDLAWPARGRFLIQGLNESGKSTLFEAVFFALFGTPLPSDGGRGKLDELIRYGASEARVNIELELGRGRRLAVRRVLRQGRPNVWELDVVGADGGVEEVRGNGPVNDRIEAELGLDADALLNTCFVEQKKLDKLEGQTRAQRERSLMKLLNLDRLVALEEQLRVKEADEEAVRRLEAKAELAELTAKLPRLEAEAAELEQAARELVTLDRLDAALSLRTRLEAIEARLEAASGREQALVAQAAEARVFADGLAQLRSAAVAHERAAQAEAGAGLVQAELERAQAVRTVDLPALQARGRALARLRRRLEWLEELRSAEAGHRDAVEAADAQLDEVAQGRERLDGVGHALVAAKGEARDVESRLEAVKHDARAFDVREALVRWAMAVEAQHEAEQAHPGVSVDAGGLTDRRRWSVVSAVAWLVAIVAFGALGTGWAGIGDAPLWAGVVAIAAVVSAGLGLWAVIRLGAAGERARVSEASRHAAEAQRERRGDELASAVARLRELNAVAPATLDRAATAVAEIDARLGARTRADVAAELEGLTGAAARLAARVEALALEEAQLRTGDGRFDAAALGRRRDAEAHRADRLAAVALRRRVRLAPVAERLGTALDLEQLARAQGACEQEQRRLAEILDSATGLERKHAAAARAAEAHWEEARGSWQRLPAVAGLPDWRRDMDAEAWDAAAALLKAAHDVAGGAAIGQAAERAVRTTAGLAGERAELERSLDVALDHVAQAWAGDPSQPEAGPPRTRGELEAARQLLAGGGLPPGPAQRPIAVPLFGVTPEPPSPPGPRRPQSVAEAGAALEGVRGHLEVTRHEIARLQAEVGPPSEPLDAAAARALVAAQRRELDVRTRAAAIVSTAARRVVREVLPSTLDYMRRLLPHLTDGRYFDAQLADDYRIEVFDDRAGAWRRKDLFSGGAKDQFSLALRLAFALATLPEERGAAPSFLFLDEPLGGFDVERARALVEVLTEGEVAESFDQVFLISHVPVSGALFDYRVVLDDGVVVSSDLPALAETQRAEVREG